MDTNYPGVEPLARIEPYRDATPQAPWHQSGRVKLFCVAFVAIALPGLIWTFLQPVVYRSSATVLMSAPTAIDAAVSAVDIQNVAIQRKILLGNEITRWLVDELAGEHSIYLDAGYLTEVLRVEPMPDTNLVEMIAQGEDEEVLPILVGTWIDVYIGIRADNIEQSKSHTLLVVQDELDGLAVKIEQTREALEQYREEYNIISTSREENAAASRLKGLNKALNNAIEDQVKAKVYLETLRESISMGKVIVPKDEMRALDGLESELQQLQAEWVVQRKRYTMEYINKDPHFRAIPERIAELERDIASRASEGQKTELAAAERAYAAAGRAVQELQQKLDEHRQKAVEFNRVYATHEALVEDLAELEDLNRETQARLVQVEVRQVEKYPQVSIIEHPGSTSERVGPDYLVLLGATFGAALGVAIFSVWLYGFLGHRKSQPAYVTLSGVHLYPQEVSGELGYVSQPDPKLTHSETRLLQEGVDPAGSDENGADPGASGR